MARKSLRVSPENIEKVKRAFKRTGLTQNEFASEVDISTRQPIGKFLSGKTVDHQLFKEICFKLDLDWQEVADLYRDSNFELDSEKPELAVISESDNSHHVDLLIQEIRQKISSLVQERCGKMRVLDMCQPIQLDTIYTDVNILEKITGRRRLKISQLLDGFDLESHDFNRLGLSKKIEERVSGLIAVERYSKLMILGKPGAGKTTFLKYLAIQSIYGQYHTDRVPIFVTLKEFAETQEQLDLISFINYLFNNYNVDIEELKNVLKSGKAFILLDGLDEVIEEDIHRVLKQIQDLFKQYNKNIFVITCRIAAKEYTLENFTEVELADFDDEQIKIFVEKWFQSKNQDFTKTFIEQLKHNKAIKELATNPLLLTMLCLEFEDSGDFPDDRSELYKRATHTLLRKWDSTRMIRRDNVYKKLTVQRKEDLLSQIAMTTFERRDYFFKQRDIERYIADYIRNLPDAQPDPEALQIDSEPVLKSIEAQHGLLVERARGIYSFSHLTFHEYFTARKIVASCNPYSLNDEILKNLVTHINDYRWLEVLSLTIEMLPDANSLLLLAKRHVDSILANDEKLQGFLYSIYKSSLSVDVPYKSAAIRAFYFTQTIPSLGISADFTLACDIDNSLDKDIDNYFNYLVEQIDKYFRIEIETDFSSLKVCLALFRNPVFMVNIVNNSDIGYNINILFDNAINYKLKQELQRLKNQLPRMSDINRYEDIFTQWVQKIGKTWLQKFKGLIKYYYMTDKNWQFSKEQKERLNQYYGANMALVDCLKSNCYLNPEVRSHIEDTLLLPIAEIEKRQIRE
ncbi:NACHT domain family protein [Nostoc sp. HK-01]|nr:NACHT domain family protein [Nostoc sp. HK-01]